jgi:hypothetical protein
VAVHDALANRAGVSSQAFTVPPSTEGPRVSSLVVVRRGERVPPDQRPQDSPLLMGDVQLYPSLGDPVSKTDGAVTLYFVVAPRPPARPTITLEVIRDGGIIARLPVGLDPAQSTGDIRQLLQLPLSALPAGRYTLRLLVEEAGSTATREAVLEITS